MAAQNVSDLQLAIVELDGCIFPLNHYRYNFYKNLCKKSDVPMTKKEFYNSLGNMYTMYDQLPLSTEMNSATLNQKVEKDLFNYLKLKGQKPNDGVIELFEYFHQKNIKIAVITTHKTKNAISYLKLGEIYHKVDYVIGNDTKLQPLPAIDMIDFLMRKYDVEPSQTLLLTSIGSILDTGAQLGVNMILMEDLVPASDIEKDKAYKVCSSMYETLNDVIFGRYEDYKMYESVLGMGEELTRQELHDVHSHLTDIYGDDENLINIIDKTYEYRLSELNEEEPEEVEEEVEDIIEEEPQEELVEEVIEEPEEEYEYVEVEEEPEEEYEYVEVEEEPEDEYEYVEVEEDDDDDYEYEEVEEVIPVETINLDAIKEVEEGSNSLSLSEDASQELTESIEQVMPKEEVIEETPEEPKEKGHPILSGIINVVFTLVLSLVILILGVVIYVLFMDQFNSGSLKTIADIYGTYSYGVNSIAKAIFNALHGIISAVPDYVTYSTQNRYLSQTAVSLVNIYVANTLIIALIQFIIYKIRNRKG